MSEHKKSILIVDDEQDIRNLISDILSDEGYNTHSVSDSQGFEEFIKTQSPDLVILDIWLQDSRKDGLEILQEFKENNLDTPVVMISGHGNIETAVEAIKYGAYDFIEKPFKSDRLILLTQRALETSALKLENKSLRQKIDTPVDLVGESSQMSEVKQTIARAAPTNSRVLITGEAGAGKDVAAKLLHQLSHRANYPFRVLNCAVLHPERLEQELFGHEKSSNTSEISFGVLEQANGGTLFLDEVADMPLETQGKIVRVIQEQSFNRVGGNEQIHVDVRIVASSNRNLEKAMQEGWFRQDLYYRLSVVPIHLPPLRERQADISALCDYFITEYARQTAMPERNLSEAALAVLQSYEWPGNVRQLKNSIEWVMIMSGQNKIDEIALEDLPPDINKRQLSDMPEDTNLNAKDVASMPLKKARKLFERDYLSMQLARFDGNISRTASFIGMERSALHRKIKTLDLEENSSQRTSQIRTA